jgi:hypothetical protein
LATVAAVVENACDSEILAPDVEKVSKGKDRGYISLDVDCAAAISSTNRREPWGLPELVERMVEPGSTFNSYVGRYCEARFGRVVYDQFETPVNDQPIVGATVATVGTIGKVEYSDNDGENYDRYGNSSPENPTSLLCQWGPWPATRHFNNTIFFRLVRLKNIAFCAVQTTGESIRARSS